MRVPLDPIGTCSNTCCTPCELIYFYSPLSLSRYFCACVCDLFHELVPLKKLAGHSSSWDATIKKSVANKQYISWRILRNRRCAVQWINFLFTLHSQRIWKTLHIAIGMLRGMAIGMLRGISLLSAI